MQYNIVHIFFLPFLVPFLHQRTYECAEEQGRQAGDDKEHNHLSGTVHHSHDVPGQRHHIDSVAYLADGLSEPEKQKILIPHVAAPS